MRRRHAVTASAARVTCDGATRSCERRSCHTRRPRGYPSSLAGEAGVAAGTLAFPPDARPCCAWLSSLLLDQQIAGMERASVILAAEEKDDRQANDDDELE